MLPTANGYADPLDQLRRSACERDEMRREREARRETREAEEREREQRELVRADDAEQARAHAAAWWAQIDARIVAYMEPLGPMLGEVIGEERQRRREETKAAIDAALVQLLTARDGTVVAPAAFGPKDLDQIIDRAVDATRSYVRDRIESERKAFAKMLDGEIAARKAAIATASKALRTELKSIISNAVLPLKCELSTATKSIVTRWQVDREAYTLTAQLGPLLNGWTNFDLWLPVPKMQFAGVDELMKKYAIATPAASFWRTPPCRPRASARALCSRHRSVARAASYDTEK